MDEGRQKEGGWREGMSKERKGRRGEGERRGGMEEGQGTHRVSVTSSGSLSDMIGRVLAATS